MHKRTLCWCNLFVSALLLLSLAEQAQAQIHGVTITKGCLDSKATDTTNCVIQVGYNDDFGDTITIQEAYDRVDPLGDDVRVPAAGNLPIDAVSGNTTCTVGGALPCNIGPAGSTLDGLPGLPDDGVVVFRQDQYVVQPGDPDPLLDVATVVMYDQCDAPDTQGCVMLPHVLQFSAATNLFQPCIELTKECSPDPVQAGASLMYTVVIDNCSSMDSPPLIIDAITDSLQGDLTDPANYDASDCPVVGGTLPPGASCTIAYSFTVDNCDVNPIENTASVESHPQDFPNDVDASDTASCGCEEAGGQGCGPGYWKLIDDDPANASHECYWEEPYDPEDLFSETCAPKAGEGNGVCDVGNGACIGGAIGFPCAADPDCDGVCFEDAFPGKTLIQVLDQDVDAVPQLRVLGFHSVAALLNAASPHVNYAIATPLEVIEPFNGVFPGNKSSYVMLKRAFTGSDGAEQGCPLGNCFNHVDGAPPVQPSGDSGGPTTGTESSGTALRARGAVASSSCDGR